MKQQSNAFPEDLAVGRLDLGVPGLGEVKFSDTKVSDVQPFWVALKPGQSAAQWIEERTAQVQSGTLSSGRKDALVRSYRTASQQPMLIYWKYPAEKTLRVEGFRMAGDQVLVGGTDAYADEVQGAETDIVSVLSSFRPTSTGEKVRSGFAIDRGVLTRPFDTNESTSATADLRTVDVPSEVRLQLQVNTRVYSNGGPSTVKQRAERTRVTVPLLKAEGPEVTVRTLRLTTRSVAGLSGDEWLSTVEDKEKAGMYTVRFEYEFGGDASDPVRPYTDIVLTGQDIPRTVSQEKLVLLWDAMLNSARFHE